MDRQEFIKLLPYANPEVTIKDLDRTVVRSITASDNLNPNRAPGHYNLDICKEECAELIQELSKETRGIGDHYNILQELADVIICARTAQIICNISDDELKRAIHVKLMRLEDSINRNGYHQ